MGTSENFTTVGVFMQGGGKMMKSMSIVAFGALLALLNNGCVYSYHGLEIPGRSAGKAESVHADPDVCCRMDDLHALHTWRRTLFYPRGFSFFYLREGAYPVLLLEAVCRLPTIFFEVPFNCINRGEKRVELCLPGIGPTNVDVAAGPVMLSKDEVVALSQNEKLKGFDIQVWSDVGYRLGGSIYLIDTHVTQENLSLFGVAFSSPSAVVWRIDPITGEREVLVSFDRGKIIVEDPPRKVVSRYE